MTAFTAQTDDYEDRVRTSLARQNALTLMGAELVHVEPGLVKLQIAHDDRLTQQHGFIHAGITTTLLDSAVAMRRFP
jgi:acyl-coenzyme A thioesterase PaaI-like protein